MTRATSAAPKSPPSLTKDQVTLNYLYERYLENPDLVTVISIESANYNQLKTAGMISFSVQESEDIRKRALAHIAEKQIESTSAKELQFMKCFGVLEFFKQLKAKGQTAIFYLQNPEK